MTSLQALQRSSLASDAETVDVIGLLLPARSVPGSQAKLSPSETLGGHGPLLVERRMASANVPRLEESPDLLSPLDMPRVHDPELEVAGVLGVADVVDEAACGRFEQWQNVRRR